MVNNTFDHQLPTVDLSVLNDKYSKLDVYKRVEKLYLDFAAEDIMLTSSFAATSAFLLKVFSDINPNQLIFFIDTGYHFKETLIYKEYLTQLYNLNVKEISASTADHQSTLDSKLWASNPDKCCQVNKVDPLQSIKKDYKVWVSGLMRWQSDFRESLNYFENKKGITKFYPLLDIDFVGRDEFIKEHHLPFHPLKSKGYSSIGCHHCTVPSENRSGRWNNAPKTECGLHL